MTYAIDIIGALFDAPADPEGEPTLLEGFHVNVTPAVMSAHPDLTAHVVEPSPLRRVWAGDDPANPIETVPLRFTDEAEWSAAGLSPPPDTD